MSLCHFHDFSIWLLAYVNLEKHFNDPDRLLDGHSINSVNDLIISNKVVQNNNQDLEY